MNICEYAAQILNGPNIEDKLISSKEITDFSFSNREFNLPKTPGRSTKISFSEKQIKFPKKNTLHIDENKALALHFFANHELLAIEMMAAAILRYPVRSDDDLKIKRGLIATIEDEQKHFSLYCNRMKDWGVSFGDYPLNNFFWRQMGKLETVAQFFSLMSLTFEAANLDFSLYYKNIFTELNDMKTAKILNIVYEDEISHVALGRKWLDSWKNDKTLWLYYLELLPDLITPSRSKGIMFDRKGRERAGLDKDYIDQAENFDDSFKVTKRKEWK